MWEDILWLLQKKGHVHFFKRSTQTTLRINRYSFSLLWWNPGLTYWLKNERLVEKTRVQLKNVEPILKLSELLPMLRLFERDYLSFSPSRLFWASARNFQSERLSNPEFLLSFGRFSLSDTFGFLLCWVYPNGGYRQIFVLWLVSHDAMSPMSSPRN